MPENEYLMTTGQFAKLHRINKRTLHYYDEAGLFSPACKGENGYRYYTYRQSPTLEMLLAFRDLGVSVDEIRRYMDNRSVSSLRQLISEQIGKINESIRRLEEIRQIFEEKEQMLSCCESSDLNKIRRITCKENSLLRSPLPRNGQDGLDFPALLAHLHKAGADTVYKKSCGSMLSVEHILAGDFTHYDYLFTRTPSADGNDGSFYMPSGSYLMAFCVGEWSNLPDAYRRVLDYAREHRLTLLGYAYEEGMNEMAINGADEYITRILLQYEG